jgi:hypothetical protein
MTNPTADFSAFADGLAGQYSLEREIGRGGMGVVYLARDLNLDRLVAIKTLPPHLATDAKVRERFLREARTAGALSHPNIVPIHRADELGGQVFFVMGFVDGESLAQRIRSQGRLAPLEVISVMRDVAVALEYAHIRGVVHRDIKAENILIDRATGRAMVTDFGIARLAAASPLTATGLVLGTVYYMSPEQVSGEPVDGRADLYSLGVAAYLALSGRFPFESETASAVLVAHVTKTAPPLLAVAPDVPRALSTIIDRCLAKDAAGRFQNGGELADALAAAEPEVERHAANAGAPRQPLLSDTEAQAVWQRAAELQAMTGVQPRPLPIPAERDAARDAAQTSGFQLGEVREAALEAGISSKYVEHALVERGLVPAADGARTAVAVRDRSSAASIWSGGSMTIDYEIVVDGEMPEDDFDLLIDIIRRGVKDVGQVSQVGRSFTWNAMSTASQRRVGVSVLPRGGRTTIHVTEDLRQIAGGVFGGIMGGGGGGLGSASMGITMGALHSPIIAVTTLVGLIGAAYGTARTIFSRVSHKRQRSLRQLVEDLAEQARQSIGTPPVRLNSPKTPLLKP